MGHDAIARSINIRTMIKVRRMVVNQDTIVQLSTFQLTD